MIFGGGDDDEIERADTDEDQKKYYTTEEMLINYEDDIETMENKLEAKSKIEAQPPYPHNVKPDEYFNEDNCINLQYIPQDDSTVPKYRTYAIYKGVSDIEKE